MRLCLCSCTTSVPAAVCLPPSAVCLLWCAAFMLAAGVQCEGGGLCNPACITNKCPLTAHMFPVRVQVHTNHSQVSALGPLLGSAVAAHLYPYSSDSAPLQIMTAAFPGCVQMLANVIGLRGQLPTSSSSSSGGDNGVLAQRLVTAVQGRLAESGSASSSSSSLTTRPGQPGVDIAVGDSTASVGSGPHHSTSSSSSAAATVLLQSVDPVCLITDQDQEIRISLALAGPQTQQQQQPECQGHSSCDGRLLVFTDAGVVLDQDVNLLSQRIRCETQQVNICPALLGLLLLNAAPTPAHLPCHAMACNCTHTRVLFAAAMLPEHSQPTSLRHNTHCKG